MAVPQFDIPSFVNLWLPPDKRLPKFLAGFTSFLSGLTWKNNVFRAYMNGDSQPVYDGTITYNTGNAVQYNFSTYESITDNNTGNPPDVSPDAWTLRCKSFIGAAERAWYNGRYLTLTYALNRYFGTTFRQPPYPAPYDNGLGGGTWSDIYITNDPITLVPFVVGPGKATSSVVALSTTTAYVPLSPVYTTSSSYSFIVNIPVGVWTALGGSAAIRDTVVNAFVSKYAPAGIQWRIVTY